MSPPTHLPAPLLRIKTSGSMGAPKAIERSPYSWERSARAEAKVFSIGSVGERFAVIGSPTHSLWAYAEFRAHRIKSDFLGLQPGQMAAAELLEQLIAYDPSCLYAVPDLLVGLLGKASNGAVEPVTGLPNLKKLLLGGGAWQPSFEAGIASFAPNARVHLFYGTAEASFIGHCQPHEWPWYRPFPEVLLRVDPTNSCASPQDSRCQIGPLSVSSPYIHSAVDPASDNQEWVSTSDVVELRHSPRSNGPPISKREDGCGGQHEHGQESVREDWIEYAIEFRLIGRVGRQFRHLGQDISPEAIEEFIVTYWPETQAAVLVIMRARPRLRLVYCGPAQGVDSHSSLKEALRQQFPQLPMLEGIHRIPQWPRLASGKTDFQALEAFAVKESA